MKKIIDELDEECSGNAKGNKMIYNLTLSD